MGEFPQMLRNTQIIKNNMELMMETGDIIGETVTYGNRSIYDHCHNCCGDIAGCFIPGDQKQMVTHVCEI